jgi:hypothetical protein
MFTRYHLQPKYSLYIFVIVPAVLLGCVASLTINPTPLLDPHKTSSRKTTLLDMQSRDNDAYRYMYVHPTIRDVLLKEPETIAIDFLDAQGIVDAGLPILVNAEKCTIKWALLEEYIGWSVMESNTSGLQTAIPMETLVTLASQCELAIFQESKGPLELPAPIRGVLNMIPPVETSKNGSDEFGGHVLIATLISLNMLENSIRHLTGKEHGRAPLLKDMIEIIARREGDLALPNSMVMVLRSLLLPNNGINLRNVLWHGFLPAIDRRWFALSIVLTLSIDDLARTTSFVGHADENLETLEVMRRHKGLAAILDHGRHILSSHEKVNILEEKLIKSHFVPRSHRELCRVALKYAHCPVIFASVVGPLIEHALRIWWCDENQQSKYIAEPGSYYVTLDGHGQRDKHEIVLMPFLSQPQNESEEIRNRLVYRLGGPTTALLVDMFASPPGAPNIRASVAHGLFNRYLFEELEAVEVRDNVRNNVLALDDMTNALISILDVLSHDDGQYNVKGGNATCTLSTKWNITFSSYRPHFSFSALLLGEVDDMVDRMKPFYRFICDGHHHRYSNNLSQTSMQRNIESKMAKMSQSIETIVVMRASIYNGFATDKSQFTAEKYFQERSSNLMASECGSARLLISEIAMAASSTLEDLNYGIAELQREDMQFKLSSRRRKQISRMCAVAELTLNFYSFAAYCALLYIGRCQSSANNSESFQMHTGRHDTLTNDVLFTAVKRSRMVLSTFSTAKMLDRALRALEQYTVGKAIKAICEDLKRDLVL